MEQNEDNKLKLLEVSNEIQRITKKVESNHNYIKHDNTLITDWANCVYSQYSGFTVAYHDRVR